MKKLHVLFAVCLASLFIASCSQKNELQVQDDSLTLKSASVAGKYIVVLKEDADIAQADLQTRNFKVKEKALGLLKKYEVTGEIEEVYESALQGFTIKMAPGQVKKMEMDSNVGYIEVDKVISLSPIEMNGKPAISTTTQPAQTTPWGITRVGGGTETYTGSGVAWIIDTGIDFYHPDLNVDVSRSKTFVTSKTADDDNGHGTHVAGTIAAINNTIGVVGVAPGATLVAVKVLSRSGSGTVSGVISGINYVKANGKAGDVANMSLGGSVSTALDDAVSNASAVVKFALAAGNESDDANNHSPARINGPNIYTVSAMDKNDNWASWSNFGNPPVDYCAPGVSILSTWKGGGYNTISGTSMATPHVAGLLLLGNISVSGYVKNDPDKTGGADYPNSTGDPIAHR
jgi:subtilisin family serine protease